MKEEEEEEEEAANGTGDGVEDRLGDSPFGTANDFRLDTVSNEHQSR